MPHFHNPNLAGAGGQGGAAYEIEQSLRFDGSSRLNRTTTSAGSSTTWTISLWVKLSDLSTGGGYVVAHSAGSIFEYYQNKIRNSQGSGWIDSDGTYRDPSAWLHFVGVKEPNKYTTWVNGRRENTQDSGTSESNWCKNSIYQAIGANAGNSYYWDGYLAEMHSLDGTAVSDPDGVFGEFDNNGVWRPIEYTGGNYGTNGFYLKFDPSATNGIGHDHSGNGNNFTPTGFTTSGTGTDVMSDTPTTNYATINPIDIQNGTLSNGNLDITATAYNYSTIGVTSGKWYYEYTIGTSGGTSYNFNFGFNQTSGKYVALNLCNGGNSPNNYNVFTNTNGTVTDPTGSRPSLPATIGCKLDLDNGSVEFLIGGVVNGTATGITDFNSDPIFVFLSHNTGTFSDFPCTVNFGQRAFSNTIPTGYSALNTANLPAPDIADGSQNMMPVLWTGTGSARTQGGYNFQPDLLWIMRRDASGMSVRLHDVVRGDNGTVMYRLQTNDANSEDTDTDVTGLTSTGFTIGNDGSDHPNILNATYVGWGWKAAQNSGSSIAAGSIDGTNPTIASTVSANPTAGFSIVTYAGSGTGGDSIGHGLGVPPKMIIVKSRGGGPYPTASWGVYHEALGASKWLTLDTTAAAAGPYSNPGNLWYNTAPTSTVFYVGNLNETNGSNDYVAYCFAEIEGYSKFGTYTGNNSTDGPFVYCGFRPALVLAKSSTLSSTPWWIIDSTRSPYNLADKSMRPDNTVDEQTGGEAIDFLSNGFKIRTTDSAANWAYDYIFMALAENPFGGSGVSPATAR